MTFSPYADSFPLDITRADRARIRAPWWWRTYLRNLRVEYRAKYANRPLTAADRRALRRYAFDRTRAGELPSAVTLAFEYRRAERAAEGGHERAQ